ncbi:MAG TPA: hypothetical protein IGS37_09150 [Synechococcales cyanobacterium M55_K2018_004]|nr:hypothetical protein [Synechococcales cyanobacterium M55_K2018_004]
MSDPIFHRQIVPLPQPTVDELLMTYVVTFEFHQEVRYRQAFEEYCQWCYRMAEQHQQEVEAMRSDINLLAWFNRTAQK